MKPILAIVVLYRMRLEESPTFRTLHGAFLADPSIAEAIDLIVVDNSPEAQEPAAGFSGDYVHDGQNPGLAARYNLALQRAAAEGKTWLLLLDQDTCLTAEYLKELVQLSGELAGEEQVVAIVPKLVEHERMQSPHLPLYFESSYPLDLSTCGLIGGFVRVFNSGAMERVKAVQAIGGFPETYPMNFLDHATFTRLQGRGGRIFLMKARLQHELSVNNPDWHKAPNYALRHGSQLAAEVRFYREHASPEVRLRHRMDMLRALKRSLRHRRYAEAGRLLRAVLAWPGAI